MANSIFSATMSNTTTATFRAWGSTVSAQIGAMLTRVPQTGDIDWATVTAPANGTFAGSEVYRFNDALQSTAPLFLKFEYGTGASSVVSALRLTVGKSADGAGNIGGVLLAATTVVSHGAALAPSNCYTSGGSSWFALSLAPVEYFGGGLLYIERSVNSGGAPTGNAILIGWQSSAASGQNHRFIDYTSTATESVTGGIIAMPLSLATDRSIANGTTTPVFPAACVSPVGLYWRPLVILGTARQNAGLGEIINSLLDGNTYLSLGVGSRGADQRGGAFATSMIRWV